MVASPGTEWNFNAGHYLRSSSLIIEWGCRPLDATGRASAKTEVRIQPSDRRSRRPLHRNRPVGKSVFGGKDSHEAQKRRRRGRLSRLAGRSKDWLVIQDRRRPVCAFTAVWPNRAGRPTNSCLRDAFHRTLR